MAEQPRMMSEILKEMSETLLHGRRRPVLGGGARRPVVRQRGLERRVGLDHPRDGYRNAWETIEAENPELWTEFESNDINALIDELVRYKRDHYPDDRRRILTCGIPDGKVRVEWLNAAAPGVDSKWEMQLYGLVRTGQKEKAIRFLQETRRMTRSDAVKRVGQIAAELGMK